MKNHEDIMLSVVFITFNQASYVKAAIESILSQKINFNMELLIADDGSNDGTAEVLLNYKRRYSDMIKLILRKQNVGATKNAYQLLAAARGRYIASLEGDDFWTDEEFLQSSVDFLNMHSEYVAFAGRCAVCDEKGRMLREDFDFGNRDFWKFDKNEYTMDDFREWRMPGHISAVVYRNYYKENGYDGRVFYGFNRMIGDRTTLLELVLRGKIFCSSAVVMCYRFVENVQADNWMSLSKRKNKRFGEYRLICKYESYAMEQYSIKLDMSKLKRSKLAAAAIVWMSGKNSEDLGVLFHMITYEGKVLSNLFTVIKAMAQKKYWISHGQPEHRVEV